MRRYPPPAAARVVRRILLVDDDEVLLRSTARSLRRRWQVHTAADHDQALAIAQRDPIDLAFVDLILGDTSGITLIRELRRVRPRLIAILVSAYASLAVAVDAARAGAYAVHRKPVDLRALVYSLGTTPEKRPLRIPSLEEMEHAYILG